MDKRTFEGPMDWEYQNNRGPLDMTSPFAQVSRRSFAASTASSTGLAMPFATFGLKGGSSSPQREPPSPSKQAFPRPPSSSIFRPPASQQYPSASPFRNPAFTTPQKRADEVFSECSGTEESPAIASDASMMPEDTPEYDAFDRGLAGMTIVPRSGAARKLFSEKEALASTKAMTTSSRTPGRGEVPRGRFASFFNRRDKVRKRKRHADDRDVGSVRDRMATSFMSDDSDDGDVNGWVDERSRRSRAMSSRGHHSVQPQHGYEGKRGAIESFFSVIHDYPNVPLILSRWVRLGVNVFMVSVFMWVGWNIIAMMRADISHEAEEERSLLLAKMNDCAQEYTKNRCAPLSERLPALNVICNEWEVCMNRDPSSVMQMQVSAKTTAEIVNSFLGTISIRSWCLILSFVLVLCVVTNVGFGHNREEHHIQRSSTDPAVAQPSQNGRGPGPVLPRMHDQNQAYIVAPIRTPRNLGRQFLIQADTPTDTEADTSTDSPLPAQSIPPGTPLLRRSPGKNERYHSSLKPSGRCPTKGN